MNVFRRMAQGLLAGALIVGFASPAFAAEPLTGVFDEPNPVTVQRVATAIGEVNVTTGVTTFVSAVETTDHALRVQAYYVNSSDVLLGRDAELGGVIKDADIDRIGGNGLVVVAAHLSTNEMKLIAYDVTSGVNNREITRFPESTQPAFIKVVGDITINSVGSLNNSKFVTAVRNGNGTMRLDSWVYNPGENKFTNLDTKLLNSNWGDFKMISNYSRGWSTFVTAHQNDQGNMVLTPWFLDQNGIMIKGNPVTRGVVQGFDLALSSNRLYSASYTNLGVAQVEYWEVDNTGNLTIKDIRGNLKGKDLQVFEMHDGKLIVVYNSLGSLDYQVMTKTGNTIEKTGDSVIMNKDAAGSFDGNFKDDRLFFGIKSSANKDLSHQLWKY